MSPASFFFFFPCFPMSGSSSALPSYHSSGRKIHGMYESKVSNHRLRASPHKVMGQSPPSACRAALWGKFQSVCLTPTQRADFWLCGRPTRHCHGLWLHTSTTQIESEILCSFSWSTYSFNFYKLRPCRNEGVWFMSPPPSKKMCHITTHLGADSWLVSSERSKNTPLPAWLVIKLFTWQSSRSNFPM